MKSAMLQKQHTEAKSFVAFPDVEKSPVKPSPHAYLNPILILVTLSIVLTIPLIYIRQFSQNSATSIPAITTTPPPTPIILVPDEGIKGNYNVSQPSTIKGPRISKVTFDPLDIKLDQQLTITVKVFSKAAVTAVSGSLQLDNTSSPLSFTKSSTSKDSENTFWITTVTLTDTALYRYILEVSATDSTGTSRATVAPRS